MKKLLASTAIAMIAMSGAASAQSVLERVLTSINAATTTQVNGTFANIAENIGGVQNGYVDTNGNVISEGAYNVLVAQEAVDLAAAAETTNTTSSATGTFGTGYDWNTAGGGTFGTQAAAYAAYNSQVADLASSNISAGYTQVSLSSSVDGSITNAIQGVTAAVAAASQSASAGSTIAYQFDLPTYDLGALSTTVLGAVNTGTITLGVNSTVDDAKTSSTQAVSSVMAQLGGSANTGAIVLNVASNMTGVNGSINNTMNDVNGAMLKASTTALGAVNTGIITSGVNAAVQGIVGTSGQTNGVAP